MYGPNWPNGGEVDIIEGANMAYTNLISAHTSANCVLPPASNAVSGTQDYTDCSDTEYGCNYYPEDDMSSYGTDFNAVGGGVYALQWTDEAISVWHFARHAIPKDVVAKQPDPRRWGPPQASFGGSACDVDSHFDDMSIVLNIVSVEFGKNKSFCGDVCADVETGFLWPVCWKPLGIRQNLFSACQNLRGVCRQQPFGLEGPVLGSQLYRRVHH